MGRRGPPPQPNALRLIKGDHHKGRYNLNEPIPRGLPLECPDDVSDEVRAIWDFTVRELDAMGIAYRVDRDPLRCYCEAVVSHRRACEMLKRSSLLVKGPRGNLVRNPALQIQRDTSQTVRAFAQEFGLTPSARSRIETGESSTDQENPFAGTG